MARRRRIRVRPITGLSLNRMIPNILTMLALCAGMTAIRLAIDSNFKWAAVAVIVAGILDGMDGRIARLLKGTTPFGAQLDSLSDFVSFGVAPAVMLYLWTMHQLSSVGWVLVLLFGACCALRLARFNTQIGAELPSYAYNFFTGVPAPMGAFVVMLPLFLSFQFGLEIFRSPYVNGAVLAAVAVLMISRVPTYSFKRLRLSPEGWMVTILVVVVVVAFTTTEPWATLLVLLGLYLGSIPLSIRSYGRLRRAAEELRAAGAHETPVEHQEHGAAAP